jgi:hypothetical protein
LSLSFINYHHIHIDVDIGIDIDTEIESIILNEIWSNYWSRIEWFSNVKAQRINTNDLHDLWIESWLKVRDHKYR